MSRGSSACCTGVCQHSRRRAPRGVVVVANSSAIGSSSALRCIPPDGRSRRPRSTRHALERSWLPHPLVGAVSPQELLVGAPLDDPAVVKDDDLVDLIELLRLVRDEQGGTACGGGK